jgi:hypothetical protein
MRKRDTTTTMRLLEPYADRFERCGLDTGGWCVTAYWLGGGQRLFYSLSAVRDWLQDREERQKGGA